MAAAAASFPEPIKLLIRNILHSISKGEEIPDVYPAESTLPKDNPCAVSLRLAPQSQMTLFLQFQRANTRMARGLLGLGRTDWTWWSRLLEVTGAIADAMALYLRRIVALPLCEDDVLPIFPPPLGRDVDETGPAGRSYFLVALFEMTVPPAPACQTIECPYIALVFRMRTGKEAGKMERLVWTPPRRDAEVEGKEEKGQEEVVGLAPPGIPLALLATSPRPLQFLSAGFVTPSVIKDLEAISPSVK